MNSLGFYIGTPDDVPKAELLMRSVEQCTHLRNSYEITAVTPLRKRLFSLGGVSVIRCEIPSYCQKLPFLDKIYAASVFERECGSGYLWIDADSCFLQNPSFLSHAPVCVNPVDLRNIGVRYGQKPDELWQTLYDYFGLDAAELPCVRTTVTQEEILPYYNAGMVLCNENRNLFRETEQCIRLISARQEHLDIISRFDLSRIFFHQAALSCAMLHLYEARIEPLPHGMNVPLHLHGSFVHPLSHSDIISIRYDDYFDTHHVPDKLSYLLSGE